MKELNFRTDNNATRIHREILVRIAKLFMEGRLEEEVDRIPLEMRPRGGESVRCCVFKDRAVLKYRCMAALGHRVEAERDELTSLADYARAAMDREVQEGPVLTVLDLACSACVRSRYLVTEACRGCLARPCTLKCPRKAIAQENGQARIDHTKCVNCGLCLKACPYHAIIRVPIPCEESCPVGAITKDETGKEHIDHEKCISCGKCTQTCPFGAIMERSQLVDVMKVLRSDVPVRAMVAPAIAGQFPGEMGQIVGALHQLGFDGVAEVAAGADATANHEAEEWREKVEEGGQAFMTTSCCPAYVEAVRKHLPGLAPFVSGTPTPMHYTAKWLKENDPCGKTVFIGPCTAKRKEALDDGYTDLVLTFEELGALFVAAGIDVDVCSQAEFMEPAGPGGRGFPVSGGVTRAVKERLGKNADIRPHLVDGIDIQSMKLLKVCGSGKSPGNFLEVMACPGGCLSGPGVLTPPALARKKVKALEEEARSRNAKTAASPTP